MSPLVGLAIVAQVVAWVWVALKVWGPDRFRKPGPIQRRPIPQRHGVVHLALAQEAAALRIAAQAQRASAPDNRRTLASAKALEALADDLDRQAKVGHASARVIKQAPSLVPDRTVLATLIDPDGRPVSRPVRWVPGETLTFPAPAPGGQWVATFSDIEPKEAV